MNTITVYDENFALFGVTIEKYAGSLLLMKGDITCAALLLINSRLKYEGLLAGEKIYQIVRKED